MSDRDEQAQGSFKVVDKRRFTADGSSRPNDAATGDAGPRAPTPAPESRPIAPPAVAPRGREAPAPQARGGAEPEPPPGDIDFLSFMASLATTALAAMGALPDDRAQGLPQDMELARQYIDIIAMLQQKTRGNLTAQEQRAVAQLLADLRLQFLHAKR